MRLADEILKGCATAPWIPTNHPSPEVTVPMSRSADYARKVVTYDPIIDVSNVADYVWDQQESWSTTDKDQFPCLTPPFPSFFMEYRRPSFFTHERDDLQTEEGRRRFSDTRIGRSNWVRVSTAGWQIERYGVLFDSIDLHAGQTFDDFPIPMMEMGGKNILDHVHPDSRWIMRGTLYIKQKGMKQAQGPVGYWIGGLDERGVLLKDAVVGFPLTNLMDPDERFFWTTMLAPTFQPMLRAISYMHCKNIDQQTHTPPPKLSKAHAKKHGKPLLKYRTLVIQPLMKGGKGGSSGGGGGGEKSHHFVRGHFADYREKGLFGRENMKRIFWFDMHMRGSKDVGEVIGDYEVKSPDIEVAS